jgi:1,4-dihydroxy-2-naphthoyl-CoA hydrolase
MNPSDWLLLCRTVRFGDTDAAGVVHFTHLLEWCHRAYEESLERYGVSAAAVFPSAANQLEVGLPIVHCSADFRQPLVCGDPLTIELKPRRLDPTCFEVQYHFTCRDEAAANGLTRHLAIRRGTRERCQLSEPINRWLEASNIGGRFQQL